MVGGGTRRRRGGPAGSPDARVSSAIDPISRPCSAAPGHQAAARSINKLKPLWFGAEPNTAAKHLPLIIAYCGAAAAATAALSRRIDEPEQRRLVGMRRHRQAGDAGLAEHA